MFLTTRFGLMIKIGVLTKVVRMSNMADQKRRVKGVGVEKETS
jgi:hypothetical protein